MLDSTVDTTLPRLPALAKQTGDVYDRIVKQTRAAIRDAGFSKVAFGLSGGLDSALVATIVVDALALDGHPSENVHGIIMPSEWTSQQSLDDAAECVQRLAISSQTIDIMPSYDVMLTSLAPSFEGMEVDTTEENLQARIRAVLLMSLSNKHGWLVLSTSNFSELSVGYSTLYGDMVGAFAPLAPVYKTWVYELAVYRNKQARIRGEVEPISGSILTKEPSAELAPNQTDKETLGPYLMLDTVLYTFFKGSGKNTKGKRPGDLVNSAQEVLFEMGFEQDYVADIITKVINSEYKKIFACPGAVLPKRLYRKGVSYDDHA